MGGFQLTHVALVGARPESFAHLGYRHRSDLAMQRLLPETGGRRLQEIPAQEAERLHRQQLPLWVHNAISAPGFPLRARLAMALRRFEGELRDSRDNEVVAAVLNAGFSDRQLDPLNLPDSLPMRQRCSMLMQIGPWQEACHQLEEAFVAALLEGAEDVDRWLALPEDELEPARAG